MIAGLPTVQPQPHSHHCEITYPQDLTCSTTYTVITEVGTDQECTGRPGDAPALDWPSAAVPRLCSHAVAALLTSSPDPCTSIQYFSLFSGNSTIL